MFGILIINRWIKKTRKKLYKKNWHYIIEHFGINVEEYDVIIGYRADAFVSNSLPLSSLNKALRLGKLGEQVVLVSAESKIYYPKFFSRDNNARMTYRNEIAQTEI